MLYRKIENHNSMSVCLVLNLVFRFKLFILLVKLSCFLASCDPYYRLPNSQ